MDRMLFCNYQPDKQINTRKRSHQYHHHRSSMASYPPEQAELTAVLELKSGRLMMACQIRCFPRIRHTWTHPRYNIMLLGEGNFQPMFMGSRGIPGIRGYSGRSVSLSSRTMDINSWYRLWVVIISCSAFCTSIH